MIAFYAYKLPIEYRAKAGEVIFYNHKYYCEGIIFETTPAMFLALGTLLNINKWCYYNLMTRAYQEENKHIMSETKSKLRQNVSVLNWITAALCLAVVTPYCYFYVQGCNSSKYSKVFH